MPASSKRSFNALWLHYFAVLTIGVTVLTGVLRYVLLDWSDRNHCHALLNEGHWLDAPSFKNWQPEGCMLHSYKDTDVKPCMQNRRVVFLGDSTVRQLFFTFAHLIDPHLPSTYTDDGSKHSDYAFEADSLGLAIEFIWDPYLNTTATRALVSPPAVSSSRPAPALIVLGSGLWYLRNPASGGLPAWESTIDTLFSQLAHAATPIADSVVFLPVEEPVSSKLTADRQQTIHLTDIQAMNSDLLHRVAAPSSLTWSPRPGVPEHSDHAPPEVIIPTVFNKMLEPSQTDDGLHFASRVLTAQVNILLNYQCNRHVPPTYPFNRTCCRPYPFPRLLQGLVLVCIAMWGLVAKLFISKLEHRPRLSSLFPSGDYALHMAVFGLSIALTYLADRTSLWDKEQKQFDSVMFTVLLVVFLVAGLATMKKSDDDLGFLNRDQTDEWKGWMQIIILVYHYYGASQIAGIYNCVRVLVAAYLFMTGYGHFTYYYRKSDFSFLRIAQVLIRLNLLTLVLAYTMDTDFLFYYFAPLVSFWFLIIYFTMLAGARYNDRMAFLIPKLLVSAGLITWYTHTPFLVDITFDLLHLILRVPWSTREWLFRTQLDLWIVYVGAFTALLAIKFREKRWADHPQWLNIKRGAIGVSVLTFIWFMWFELRQPSKFAYNAYQPYVSFLPILAFVVLRNATVKLRSASSQLYTFIGKCSLETFILQYHIWLAGDTKGILIIIPRARSRLPNLVISTVMFVYVSYKVAGATTALTTWFCGGKEKKPSAAPAPVLPVVAPEPESVPLTTTTVDGSGGSKEAPADEVLIEAEQRESAVRSMGAKWVARGADMWKEDVKVRFAAGLVALWVLNLLWPTP